MSTNTRMMPPDLHLPTCVSLDEFGGQAVPSRIPGVTPSGHAIDGWHFNLHICFSMLRPEEVAQL
ncbi:hypothetical protein GCM10018771_35640 [Streptomyces cellulosae]|nr:hypothetical protein GCM10018771_35640 [Streptomyces cellulosae]